MNPPGHTSRAPDSKHKSVAHDVSRQASSQGSFQLEDRRPERLAQQDLVQRIQIGNDKNVNSTTALGAKLGISKGDVLTKFNANMVDFGQVTEATLDTYLNAQTFRLGGVSTSNPDKFMERVAWRYKTTHVSRSHSGFSGALNSIKTNQDYKDIMDKDGVNYGAGEDDGHRVDDTYREGLACSLFAILRLKPGFLGAANARQLHHIMRHDQRLRKYDNDERVAAIRIAAGLQYHVPAGAVNTVTKFTTNADIDKTIKYIIDPTEAHTFTLEYDTGRRKWKKYDNDAPNGTEALPQGAIRVYWTA
jgi:hypothetical protein